MVDRQPRSLGARVPSLGDGVYRASVEGPDGEVFVWVHIVAYGDGRSALERVRRRLVNTLEPAIQGT